MSDPLTPLVVSLSQYLSNFTIDTHQCVACSDDLIGDQQLLKLSDCQHCIHSSCLVSPSDNGTSMDAVSTVTCSKCQISSDIAALVPVQLDESCSICYENYRTHSHAIRLPLCTHTFHATCIGKWLKSESTCPLCRSEIDLPVSDRNLDHRLLLKHNMVNFIPQISPHTITCAICRTHLSYHCIECALTPKDECLVLWGECGHTYHEHCFQRLPNKLQLFCAICQHQWHSIGFTGTTVIPSATSSETASSSNS